MATKNHLHASAAHSRRTFLRGALALGATPLLADLAGCASARPTTRTGADALAGILGIDMHNHVYPAGTEPHPQHGPPPGGGPPGGGPPREEPAPGPALALPDELRRSGLTAVCASYVLDFARNVQPGDARDNLLRWFTAVDEELARGHLRRALTLRDLQAAHASGTPTIVQSVEGAHFIEGQLERIDEVYERGLRHLQLLHERDDMVTPLGDTNTGVAHLHGLTSFGADVVRRCNQLGILIDLAHAGPETVAGALAVATKPLIISHTNLDTWAGSNARMAAMMRPRLISREHARVVADAGGVIGVWTKLADSPAEFVQSVKAMVDAVGVDHVGLGTDTDLLSPREGHGTNRAWANQRGGFLPAVVTEMRRQGFHDDEVAKVAGGNYCRVFGAVTG